MSTTTAPPQAAEPAKKGKAKLLIIVAVVLLLGLGAAYWFLLRPAPDEEKKKEVHEAGEIVPLEPVQINLAGGHYLRMSIALQLTTEATHAADGSKALDSTIELFTGRSIEELSNVKERRKLKHELEETVAHDYHEEVMAVYFTEFVTQ